MSGYLDLRGLADYSCCSVRWLRDRLSDPGHPLPCYRVEGKVLVKRAEFEEWMASYRVSNAGFSLDRLVDEAVSSVTAGKPLD